MPCLASCRPQLAACDPFCCCKFAHVCDDCHQHGRARHLLQLGAFRNGPLPVLIASLRLLGSLAALLLARLYSRCIILGGNQGRTRMRIDACV